MSTNTTIVGNITQDPELRFTSSGLAVCNFSVAVNSGKDEKKKTSYFDVVTFEQLAEDVAESLSQGLRVIVTGRLQQSSWEDQEGNKRSKVEVVADEVGPSLRWATAQVSKVERES